jgi:hypothetical protein
MTRLANLLVVLMTEAPVAANFCHGKGQAISHSCCHVADGQHEVTMLSTMARSAAKSKTNTPLSLTSALLQTFPRQRRVRLFNWREPRRPLQQSLPNPRSLNLGLLNVNLWPKCGVIWFMGIGCALLFSWRTISPFFG